MKNCIFSPVTNAFFHAFSHMLSTAFSYPILHVKLHVLRRILLLSMSYLTFAAPSLATENVMEIIYPSPESASDSRYLYDWEVLRKALERTKASHGPYDMRASLEYMAPARVSLEMLTPNGRINLFVRATSKELEQKLLPIRIPVDRGLLGYRIFLVRRDDLPRFAQVTDLQQLKQFRVGQGRGWADVAILRHSGLPVVEGANYEGLFAMLQMGRFDYFSRATDEALREFSERQEKLPDIAIEPSLALYYPLPRYFFVRRDAEGEKLAERISVGLEMMIKDGSLQALFQHHKGALIERAGLLKRRLFRINNPNLSPETPLSRSELWYNPFISK